MELFTYYRSTATYRVRIALALKGIAYKAHPVNLTAGEQRSDQFLRENPQGLVPALKLNDGHVLGQSTAILEWLEETHPSPALYPTDPLARAGQRALCQHIACDIHPLNNMRVLNYLQSDLAQPAERVDAWYAHWLRRGFSALEVAVQRQPGDFSLGTQPGMLEVFLVPQVFNARRFNIDIADFTAIGALDARCQTLPAFMDAHPENQPDTPPG